MSQLHQDKLSVLQPSDTNMVSMWL